ncbi:5'-nucleotidase C-terminal domain-containing protein [candidate division KSB1 bacterium]|nr:5'-nucleotidase C-terminal domain-containing protein [candidate division KSB1 bacterium]
MKGKLIGTILFIAAFLFMASYGQSEVLTIIHVNDTHSHLVPWGPKNASDIGTIGGIARRATLIGTIKATSPNPITLHAGDVFGGDFMFNKFFGVAEFQIMASLGFDAMTLGNHEFNYYPTTLVASLTNAGFPGPFPLLSANLDMSGYPDLDPFVDDYIIKEYGDVKVGIFGLTTEETNTIANPTPVVVLDSHDPAVAMVSALTAEGCDVIICLSHLGVYPDQVLAASVPGIDIIVGGHSHTLVPEPILIQNPATGDTTYIVQANWAGSHVGKMTIDVTNSKIKLVDYEMLSADDTVQEEPTLAATVAGLVATVESDVRYGPVYSNIIAQATSLHPKELGQGEFKDTKLGDLITDALKTTAGTDVAFAANGFIRQDIYPGKLTEADIFQVLPEGLNFVTGYGSSLSSLEIEGINIPRALEFSVALLEYQDTFFLNAAGITYDFNIMSPAGARVDYASIRINGAPLDMGRRYSVAVNSDLVPLLGLTGIDTVYNVQQIALSEYAVVRDFIVQNSPIDHPGGNRIRDLSITAIANHEKPMVKAESFFLDQNYPNPFNPATTFTYSVPEASKVRISIYNSLGQEIRVLCDKFHQTGNYHLTWDGKDFNGNTVASGVYFSRLKAGDVYMARRMTLTK